MHYIIKYYYVIDLLQCMSPAKIKIYSLYHGFLWSLFCAKNITSVFSSIHSNLLPSRWSAFSSLFDRQHSALIDRQHSALSVHSARRPSSAFSIQCLIVSIQRCSIVSIQRCSIVSVQFNR